MRKRFESGRAGVKRSRPRADPFPHMPKVVELVGFAVPCREICESITGYQYQRLALMHFDDLSVRHTKCRGIGQPSCLWEMSWKARAD